MARWIQHPVTGELVPAAEYVRPYAGNRSHLPAPRIVSDSIEVQSMLDGKTYTSKAGLRQTYRAAGVEEVGNEPMRPSRTDIETPSGVGDDLKAAFSQHT